MARKRSTSSQRAKPEDAKKKIGRPRIDIDLELLSQLAGVGCSVEEIAQMLRNSGVSVDGRTIKRRLTEPEYREAMDNGIALRNFRLRSQMVKQSKLMNSAGVHMAQFLAKNWLGMTDKSSHELSGPGGGPIETRDVSARQTIASRIAGIAARRRSAEHPEGSDGA